MQEIIEGLPSVPEDTEEETDFEFSGTTAGQWTCRTC